MDGIAGCGSVSKLSMLLLSLCCSAANAQNFERYKPLDLSKTPLTEPQIPDTPLPPSSQDDRVLIDCLDAVVLVDQGDKISLDPSIDELTGIQHDFVNGESLVYSDGMRNLVFRYLNQPLSLRSLNQLAREIAAFYRREGQPIVDVQIPEQRITGGTLYLVIVESVIGRVMIQPGHVFDCKELDRWIACTCPGNHIFEENLQSDLFWLNQSPFRRVSVDFRKGELPGTTDVLYTSNDVTPIRGYMGADDSGVKSLNYGRFFTGLMYGNMFQRGGTLSYQYTTDQEFQLLNAHSVSYSQPLSRERSIAAYGSWAGVTPMVGVGLTQQGESWQLGLGLTEHLIRTSEHSQNLTFGLDFKSTNNNLEFAGSSVVASNADLVQLHLGFDDTQRTDVDQYQRFKVDTYFGPGGGLTGSHSSNAFQSIRPGTSPDYIYARLMAEQTSLITDNWILMRRFTGQVSSERLLFSETLGLGGYDTIRGFNQRSYNADNGWIMNFEVGPKTYRWGCREEPRTLRVFSFADMGNGYQSDPQAGEDAYTFALSTGAGLRYNVSDRLSCRVDYGYALNGIAGTQRENRLHFGVTWIPGERPR